MGLFCINFLEENATLFAIFFIGYVFFRTLGFYYGKRKKHMLVTYK